jgi:cytochrome P450
VTAQPAPQSVVFDPADPGVRADPYVVYRELREHAPVTRILNRLSWAVTRYDDVRALLRDPRVGTVSPLKQREIPRSPNTFLRAREDAKRLFASFMHGRAADDHARLRRLVMPAFAPSAVAARGTRIEQLTDNRIDEALARGRMDIVGDLGRPVALTIASELLGLPQEMQAACGAAAGDLMYKLDTFTLTPVRQERGLLAMIALASHLRDLLSRWRVHPPAQDGLLWALERARSRGELSEQEVVGHGAMLLFTGHITTQHVVGNGVLALLRNPDQWELLRARPELIETAVEEILRYDPPAAVLPRTALADVAIAGETIPQGDHIGLLLGAAYRDPAIFVDPDRLDITRSPNPHFGFGYDAHYCVGAALARLEARIMIGTLVRRLPAPRLEGEQFEWEDTVTVRGLRALPVVLG